MSYPCSGATYRYCIVCSRPFKTEPAELRRRASVFYAYRHRHVR